MKEKIEHCISAIVLGNPQRLLRDVVAGNFKRAKGKIFRQSVLNMFIFCTKLCRECKGFIQHGYVALIFQIYQRKEIYRIKLRIG